MIPFSGLDQGLWRWVRGGVVLGVWVAQEDGPPVLAVGPRDSQHRGPCPKVSHKQVLAQALVGLRPP